ncbi:MAG: C69 family dipeptidase [Candidatus Lokiarchaeota archaeon]|nr:C69 family dipeptidase [Candidatus Lokiarchaeota archaeon]
MCDTIVALPKATATGTVLLGKNSDRDPDEPAEVVYIPHQEHAQGEMLKCSETSIPQAGETAAVLLVKPFQIWGAEMGANEHGVTIGNETIWTREKVQREGALTGMDLLRLALERGRTAREALDVVTGLLERYPQGGQGGYRVDFYYHNSFLIADPKEAWVLECPGKYWIAEKVDGIRTISNHLSISGTGDACHPALVRHAIEAGWCKVAGDFDFKTHYRPRFHLVQWGAKGVPRMCLSTGLLKDAAGKITPETMMGVLRNHGPPGEGWRPDKHSSMHSLCIHSSGTLVPTQTTSSLVSDIGASVQTHFVTASSSPCVSLFKPVFMPAGIGDYGGKTAGTYSDDSAWWRAELLKRLVELDYPARLAAFKAERDGLEARFARQARDLVARGAARQDLRQAAHDMLAEAMEATTAWIEKVRQTPVTTPAQGRYRKFWHKWNQLDGLPVE